MTPRTAAARTAYRRKPPVAFVIAKGAPTTMAASRTAKA